MIRFNTPGLPLLTCVQGRMGLISSLLMALFLTSCAGNAPAPNSNGQPQASQAVSSPVKKEGNYIVAEPNPVPAGSGIGTTKISWGTTETASDVYIYVAADGGEETVFASSSGAAPASQEAPWIREGTKYEFRLYSGTGAGRKLLGKVEVTGQK